MKIKLLFIVTIFLISCKDKPCELNNCGEHGTCDEITESCICDQYYEGEFCNREIRSKFIANWSGTGVCDYNPGNIFKLTVAITNGLEINVVKIQSNNILQDFTMTGMLDNNNDIIIPNFRPHIGSNTYDGKIVFNPNDSTLIMTLNAYVNTVKNTCIYTLKK